MTGHLVAVSAAELAVGAACLLVAALAWPHRTQPAGTPLVVLAVAGAVWAAGAGLASLVADPTTTVWAQRLTFIAGGPAAVAWFYVAVEYAGRAWWRRPAVLGGVAALVLLDWAAILSDPLHHLYIAETSHVAAGGAFDPTPGPLLWLGAAWKVGFVVAGLSTLLDVASGRRGLLRLQALALLVTGLLPLVATVVELLDLVDVTGLDLGVVGLAGGAVIVLWALFHAEFLAVVPIARESLLESLQDAVVAIDANGRVVDVNRRAREVFDADDDVYGAPVGDLVAGYPELDPFQLPSGAGLELAATIRGEERHFALEVAPVSGRADRRPRDGSEPAPLGWLLVFRDVTDRRRHERRLERQNERLAEFASIVAHDLRSPLSVAIGRLELAREAGGDDEELDEAARALDRMVTIIDDLLSLAREGDASPALEPVRLDEVVEAAWAHLDAGEVRLRNEASATVLADRRRLRQVVENLLRNAVEHSSTGHRPSDDAAHEHGDGGVTVTVGLLDGDAGFFVEDDGGGIPLADAERVFEQGYSSAPDGTGLGLDIVADAAEAHGWELRLREGADGGARFEFRGVDVAR